jgi:GPI mannosyltransferase 3
MKPPTIAVKVKKAFLVILAVAFFLRLLFIAFSQHIYHSDEIFQTVEQSFRLVTNYGIIPWDVAHQLRSILLPAMYALPLATLLSIGLKAPSIYIPIIQIIAALSSLSLVVTGFLLARNLTKNNPAALLVALVLGAWYELIYMAPRILTETISLYLFSLAYALLMLYHHSPPQNRFRLISLATFLATLAGLFRFQYLILLFAFFFLAYRQFRSLKPLLIGVLGAVLLYGLFDLYYFNLPLITIFRNIELSFLSGISTLFGAQPLHYYLLAMAKTSAGLLLVSLLFYKFKGGSFLWLVFILLLLAHSLISHKEYRFLFAALPIGLVMSSLYLNTWLKTFKPFTRTAPALVALIFLATSFFGFTNKLPGQTDIYQQTIISHDPVATALINLHFQTDVCAIYVPERPWDFLTASYFLNRQVPLYSLNYPPPTPESYNYLITEIPPLAFESAEFLFETQSQNLFTQPDQPFLPKVYTYKTADGCLDDPDYTPYRSYPQIEEKLDEALNR